jgi:hypothetical protein
MRRAALVCCLVVGVSVNGATQPQPVRACNPVFVGELTAPPSVNFIDLDRDFDPLTIPRHFFREPPDYAVMYEVTGGKTSETGVVAVPLWKPGQEPIPVAVELPTRGGFVYADRQTAYCPTTRSTPYPSACFLIEGWISDLAAVGSR